MRFTEHFVKVTIPADTVSICVFVCPLMQLLVELRGNVTWKSITQINHKINCNLLQLLYEMCGICGLRFIMCCIFLYNVCKSLLLLLYLNFR